MPGRSVQLRVGGQNYRVVTSASEAELARLAAVLDAKLSDLGPRASGANAMLLAALAVAHDAETERAERVALERRARDVLRRVLVRIDECVEVAEEPAHEDALA